MVYLILNMSKLNIKERVVDAYQQACNRRIGQLYLLQELQDYLPVMAGQKIDEKNIDRLFQFVYPKRASETVSIENKVKRLRRFQSRLKRQTESNLQPVATTVDLMASIAFAILNIPYKSQRKS